LRLDTHVAQPPSAVLLNASSGALNANPVLARWDEAALASA